MMERKNAKGLTLSEFLAVYDENKYRRPSVAVDMAVFTLSDDASGKARLLMLMIKRKDHPCIGEWGLPGGFLNMDEQVADAAARELEEETGVKGLSHRFIGVFANVGRDPRTRTISLSHMAIAPRGSVSPEAGDDAAEAGFFFVDVAPYKDGIAVSLANPGPGLKLGYTARIENDAFSGVRIDADKGDVAFDHSLIITRALWELAALERDEVCRRLCPDDPAFAAEAIASILNEVERAAQ